MLRGGASVRVLLVDPFNEELLAAVSQGCSPPPSAEHLSRRMLATLNELPDLRDGTRDRLKIWIASFQSAMGLTAINLGSRTPSLWCSTASTGPLGSVGRSIP
jgi:hypothetical protein